MMLTLILIYVRLFMELSEVSLICKALSDQNQLQILYCGECGSRLCYGHSVRRKCTSSGFHEYPREYYRCYRKLSSANSCKGQSTYTAYPIENTVVGVVRGFFENMRGAVDSDLLEKANRRACSALQKAFEQAETEYESIFEDRTSF